MLYTVIIRVTVAKPASLKGKTSSFLGSLQKQTPCFVRQSWRYGHQNPLYLLLQYYRIKQASSKLSLPSLSPCLILGRQIFSRHWYKYENKDRETLEWFRKRGGCDVLSLRSERQEERQRRKHKLRIWILCFHWLALWPRAGSVISYLSFLSMKWEWRYQRTLYGFAGRMLMNDAEARACITENTRERLPVSALIVVVQASQSHFPLSRENVALLQSRKFHKRICLSKLQTAECGTGN